MKKSSDKNYITLFLLFSFGIPLIIIIFILYIDIFQTGIPYYILFGMEAMSPTLAALIVTLLLGGKNTLGAFLKKCYINNVKIPYFLLAFILPSIILLITKATSLLFLTGTPFITGISIKKLVIVLWALVAEELGWRGFLQEKLDKYLGYMVTPMVLGCIWALWHYHFFIIGTNSAPIILFLLGCIADSYNNYWITKKSNGNVLPASIWHFTVNLWFNLLLLNPEHNQGSNIPYLLYVIYTAIMATGITLWEIRSTRKDTIKITN